MRRKLCIRLGDEELWHAHMAIFSDILHLIGYLHGIYTLNLFKIDLTAATASCHPWLYSFAFDARAGAVACARLPDHFSFSKHTNRTFL